MISGVTELVFESVAEREKKEEVVSVLVYALEVTFIFRFIFLWATIASQCEWMIII